MRMFYGFLFFIVYVIATTLIFGHVSPSVIFFGLPCPGCGLTRAGLLFLVGDFVGSFNMHPLLIPIVLFLLVALYVNFFRRDKISMLTTPAIILTVCTLGLYIYRMVVWFPNQEPMMVNYNSILHNIIYLIRES